MARGKAAIALRKRVEQRITRSASIRGRIPPRRRWQFGILWTSFFLFWRALKAAVHSGMPRGQDLLFIGLNRSANAATTISRSRSGA
jgi:K+ transporter